MTDTNKIQNNLLNTRKYNSPKPACLNEEGYECEGALKSLCLSKSKAIPTSTNGFVGGIEKTMVPDVVEMLRISTTRTKSPASVSIT